MRQRLELDQLLKGEQEDGRAQPDACALVDDPAGAQSQRLQTLGEKQGQAQPHPIDGVPWGLLGVFQDLWYNQHLN